MVNGLGSGESTPVLSLLHVRPLLPSEQAAACCNIVNVEENETVNVHGRRYAFDCVVGEGGNSRGHMCQQYIRPLVHNVCNGVNCAVLAYGQTSSGKTYTMGIGKEQLQALCGDDPEAVADLVIPYALRQLFGYVEAERGRRIFTLLVSFVEVYMEKYYDLLARRQPVAAKTRCDGEVMLVGAQLRQVASMEEVIRLLQIGGLARITKGTNQNDRSSRSHAVLTIHVQSCADPAAAAPSWDDSPECASSPASGSPNPATEPQPEPPSGCAPDSDTSNSMPPVRTCAAVNDDGTGAALSAVMAAPPLSAKLHLVDLAGSESVGRAGTVGLAAKEGNNINLSLMTLRNLIQMLAAPPKAKAAGDPPQPAAAKVVLPYRDSKLTTLLRDALGGNSSTLFVACVSPADANAAMTVSTLEFATTARRIRTKPAVNIGGAGSTEVLELHRIILKLRSELEQLRRQVLPSTCSPSLSLQLQPHVRNGMTFSAAVAAASLGPSTLMQSPTQATSFSMQLSQQGQASVPAGTQLRISAPGHRNSVTNTPVSRSHAVSFSGAASSMSVADNTTAQGQRPCTSPAAAEGCGRSEPQAGETPPISGGSRKGLLDTDGAAATGTPGAAGEGGANCGDGAHCGDGSSGESLPAFRSEELPGVSFLASAGSPPGSGRRGGGSAEATRRRRVLDDLGGQGNSGDHDGQEQQAGADVGSLRGFAKRGCLRPSDSRLSTASQSSEGSCDSIVTVSSYEGEGDTAPDEWQTTAQLQQKVLLLEAENEHLQKRVGHLSAVIGDLRAQMNGASCALTPSGLPNTPTVTQLARSSVSGASLLGPSVAALATSRLQRFGASLGGGGGSMTSRTHRSTFSPLQDSPYGPSSRLHAWADTSVRASGDVGTPSFRPDIPLCRVQSQPLSEGPRQTRPPNIPKLALPCSTALPLRGPWSCAGMCQGGSSSWLSPQEQRGVGPDGPPAWSHVTSPATGSVSVGSYSRGPAAYNASATCLPIEETPEAVARTTEDPEAVTPAESQNTEPLTGATQGEAPSPLSEVGQDMGEVQAQQHIGTEELVAQQQQQQAEGADPYSGLSPFAMPVLDVLEDRVLAMLTWVSRNVAGTQSRLAAQQASLREQLTAQSLTISAGSEGLPALETLQDFAAQKLAGVEAELAGLVGTTGCGAAGEAEGATTAADSRAELLRQRLIGLGELQLGLQQLAELEDTLELLRELQMLVGVYAGLQGSLRDDVGVATGPAVARAVATAEQQLQSLRRERRQQIIKDAAVACEKLRELEAMTGPPTPQQFGVVLPADGNSSGGGSSSAAHAPGASIPPSLTASHSGRSVQSWFGGPGAACGTLAWEAGAEDLEEDGPTAPASPRARAGPTASAGKAGAPGAGAAGLSPALSPLPPLPPPAPVPPAPAQTPSLFAQLLPVLSPATGWRRSTSNKESPAAVQQTPAQHPAQSQPPVSQLQRSRSWGTHSVAATPPPPAPPRRLLLQLSQLGPWLDALLDFETRVQQYDRVLAGTLKEREAVYSQLQEVEHELTALADAAFTGGLTPSVSFGGRSSITNAGTTTRPDNAAAAAGPSGITSPTQDDCDTNNIAQTGGGNHQTDGGAALAGWSTSPLGVVLAGADPVIRQHAALLSARQKKLQKRLEELCTDVASLQMAIVDAQEVGSEASKRDDWWACVPTLALARPTLRLLLERAAEYRAAFQDAMARADKLEQQVEELGLQYQEASARLAAHALELTATRAAALAAMAAPGYTNSIGEAVSALLLQHQQRTQEDQQQQEQQAAFCGGGGAAAVESQS